MLVVTLVGVMGVARVAEAAAAAPGFFDAGVGRFLISPGLGGLAAFLGGLLAYAAARRKSGDDREATRQARWWETLTWVYDRATTGDERLPGDLALGLLEQLLTEAQTDLETAAVDSLLTLFSAPPQVATTGELEE